MCKGNIFLWNKKVICQESSETEEKDAFKYRITNILCFYFLQIQKLLLPLQVITE